MSFEQMHDWNSSNVTGRDETKRGELFDYFGFVHWSECYLPFQVVRLGAIDHYCFCCSKHSCNLLNTPKRQNWDLYKVSRSMARFEIEKLNFESDAITKFQEVNIWHVIVWPCTEIIRLTSNDICWHYDWHVPNIASTNTERMNLCSQYSMFVSLNPWWLVD